MQAKATTKRTKTDVYWIKLWEWSQEETRHIRIKQWGTQFRKSLAIPPSIRKGGGRSYQTTHDHADVRVLYPIIKLYKFVKIKKKTI